MKQGENLKRSNIPTLQQVHYLLELEKLGGRRGCVSMISETCGVNHGSVSRYLKVCCEEGYITHKYQVTEKGKLWIDTYKKILKELPTYLNRIGIPHNEIPIHMKNMIEHLEVHLLLSMIQEGGCAAPSLDITLKNDAKRKPLSEILVAGKRKIGFLFYKKEGLYGYDISRVNDVFEGNAILNCNKKSQWILLTKRYSPKHKEEQNTNLLGCVEFMIYKENGRVKRVEQKDGIFKIPLNTFTYKQLKSGEIRGELEISYTYARSEMLGIEQANTLVIWL